MKKIAKYLVLAIIGFFLYTSIEMLWRGHTYAAMGAAGALSLVIIYRVHFAFDSLPIGVRCLVDAALITLVEYAFGFVFNIILRRGMWDYSNMPLNVYGQICPLYFALWYLLCIPGDRICAAIGIWFGDGKTHLTEELSDETKDPFGI